VLNDRNNALVDGPSTSPLDVMRVAICLVTALAGLTSQASADVPECRPKRAVLSIAPLDLSSLPRIPPLGFVEVAFTIALTGRATDIVVVSSHINWSEAPTRAINVLESAQFDPASYPCRQTMKIRFDAK
jgi:hypothetical protein